MRIGIFRLLSKEAGLPVNTRCFHTKLHVQRVREKRGVGIYIEREGGYREKDERQG